MASRRGTMEEQEVLTSNLYKNRTSAYPAVIEVNTEEMDKCRKGGRNADRSHFYRPITVSSMVDEETLALRQLAPSFDNHRHSKSEAMKVSSFYQV